MIFSFKFFVLMHYTQKFLHSSKRVMTIYYSNRVRIAMWCTRNIISDILLLSFLGLRRKYNRVKERDFEYYDKLGEGKFGLVVRCKKKSTGRLYAMKIQRKSVMFQTYNDDPSRVDCEMRALACVRHPFITSMDYSFQTDKYAMIVMELLTGDGHKLLALSMLFFS